MWRKIEVDFPGIYFPDVREGQFIGTKKAITGSWVVYGGPKVGKTNFVVQLLIHILISNPRLRAFYISTEVPAERLVEYFRFVASALGNSGVVDRVAITNYYTEIRATKQGVEAGVKRFLINLLADIAMSTDEGVEEVVVVLDSFSNIAPLEAVQRWAFHRLNGYIFRRSIKKEELVQWINNNLLWKGKLEFLKKRKNLQSLDDVAEELVRAWELLRKGVVVYVLQVTKEGVRGGIALLHQADVVFHVDIFWEWLKEDNELEKAIIRRFGEKRIGLRRLYISWNYPVGFPLFPKEADNGVLVSQMYYLFKNTKTQLIEAFPLREQVIRRIAEEYIKEKKTEKTQTNQKQKTEEGRVEEEAGIEDDFYLF